MSSPSRLMSLSLFPQYREIFPYSAAKSSLLTFANSNEDSCCL